MARLMKGWATIALGLTLVLMLGATLYPAPVLVALAITAGTVAYHFLMRLAVGTVLARLPGDWRDWHHRWYQPLSFEARLYRRLQVKRWKRYMPTYAPEEFDPRQHSTAELLVASCQAEVVHEVIVVLSFLPLAVIPIWGAAPVFLLTSLGAALFDGSFVVLQRFNRPRFLRLLAHQQARAANSGAGCDR